VQKTPSRSRCIGRVGKLIRAGAILSQRDGAFCMEIKNRTQYQKKVTWKKHGFEKNFGSKMLNGITYGVFGLPILLGIFAVPVALALLPVTLLVDWLFPNLVFPYNLFFQLPIAIYVVWQVWKFLEEKD